MKTSTLIFLAVICVELAAAKKEQKRPMKLDKHEFLDKGKREAAIHSSYPPRSSHLMHHLQPAGGSLSIGAGYSFGGSKAPSFSYTPSFSSSHIPTISGSNYAGGYYSTPSFSHQGFSAQPQSQPQKMRYTSISGFQLPKSNAGHKFSGGSFNSLLNTAPQSFGPSHLVPKQPQLSFGIPHYAQLSKPESSYGTPLSYTMPHISSQPSYSAGIQGLGAFASHGFQGHLFTPAQSHEYNLPSTSYDFPAAQLGQFSFNGLDNSIGFSTANKKYAPLISTVKSHSPQHHQLSSNYGLPTNTEFKPSVYLGSSSLANAVHQHNTYTHGSPAPTYETPTTQHSSLLSANPIYVSNKIMGETTHAPFEVNSISHEQQQQQQHQDFHGSVSMTGSYELPSSGHSASSLNFGGPQGLYYGVPQFTHEGGSDHATLASVYGTPSENQETYSAPQHAGLTSAFSGFTTNHASFGNVIPAYESGYSKHKLSALSDSDGSHGSFGVEDNGKEQKSYSYQGAYSNNKNTYSAAPEEFRSNENKYDTIKYSHDFGRDQM